jgi:competence protein ComEA
MYAFGYALLLLVCSMPPQSAVAQPSETAGRANEHTSIGTHATPGSDSNTPAAAIPTPRADAAPDGAHEQAGVVNLNTATAGELERLPRIGPARAQAILALRAQVKRFSKVEQLLRVKGIGRATFRKLRPMLTLDGPTTLAEPNRR